LFFFVKFFFSVVFFFLFCCVFFSLAFIGWGFVVVGCLWCFNAVFGGWWLDEVVILKNFWVDYTFSPGKSL